MLIEQDARQLITQAIKLEKGTSFIEIREKVTHS